MLHNSDLSWIPLSERKNIDLPTVIYEDNIGQNYGGYYTFGTKEIIVVDGENNAAAIAHEYKHYQQRVRGFILKKSSNTALFQQFNYNTAIRLYFTTQLHEMEALCFEYRIAKSKLNKFWMEACVLPSIVDDYLEQ